MFNSFRYVSENWINWMCTCCASVSLTLIWLHYRRRKKSNNTKVLFYHPMRSRTCHCRKFFDIRCSNPGCSSIQTREIVYCLRRATRTIDICMFALSNKVLSKEIIAAYHRGVLIRVVVSNCILLESQELKRFCDIGIEVKYQKTGKDNFMHNKYALVDSEYLIHGSMNWTQQATFDNWENVIVTNSPSLVAVFSQAFEINWATVDL